MSESPSLSSILSSPAEEFVNDPLVESLWLQKAVNHMNTYFRLLQSVASTQRLKLTPNDDYIYSTFRQRFPQLNVEFIVEDEIKSEAEKVKWREFCMEMKDSVQDYNFATMIRLDAKSDYNETNSIVVPRAQFVAIEVARNREGCNESIKEKFPLDK